MSKIGFDIVKCSGWDSECDPKLLESTHHHDQGWESERFCLYPQHLILRLKPGLVQIEKLQFLIHNYKISTQLEFFSGSPNEWEKLGFINLNNNESTQYKARELKTVFIAFKSEYIKIVIHKCFINRLNLFNQVGILAINIHGQPCDSLYLLDSLKDPPSFIIDDPMEDPGIRGMVNIHTDSSLSVKKDLELQVSQDAHLISIMTATEESKQEAVRNEDFKLASDLKKFQKLCQQVGSEIGTLTIQKQKAVHEEDYENAEIVKRQIDQLKSSLLVQLERIDLVWNSETLSISRYEPDPPKNSFYQQDTPQINSNQVTRLSKPHSPVNSSYPVNPPSPVQTPVQKNQSWGNTQHQVPSQQLSSSFQEISIDDRPIKHTLQPSNSPHPISSPSRPSSSTATTRDQKIAPEFNLLQSPKPSVVAVSHDDIQIKSNLANKSLDESLDLLDLEATIKNIDEPEELSDVELSLYVPSIEIFGKRLVQCLLSRKFKLREISIYQVIEVLSKWEKCHRGTCKDISLPKLPIPIHTSNPKDDSEIHLSLLDKQQIQESIKSATRESLVKSIYQIVQVCLEDGREKSSMLTLSLLDEFLHLSARQGIAVSLVYKYLEDIVPSLSNKSSDTNPRVKQATLNVLMTLLTAYHSFPHSAILILLRPVAAKQPKKGKSSTSGVVNWKLVVSRLEIILLVIDTFGLDEQPVLGKTGMSLSKLMKFIIPQVSSQTAQVRDASIKVIVKCINLLDQDQVEPHLEGLRPACLQTIRDVLTESRTNQNLRRDSRVPVSTRSIVSKNEEEEEEEKHVHIHDDKLKQVQVLVLTKKKLDKKGKSLHESEESKLCIFCETQKEEFAKESDMDHHFLTECPMLVQCQLCHQITEIINLNQHMTKECREKNKGKACSKCRMVFQLEKISFHEQSCQIKNASALRCPLCRDDIEDVESLKYHLQICPQNTRAAPPLPPKRPSTSNKRKVLFSRH